MTVIFSIHYFLWYGALTSVFGYESVYARYYINASTMQYGYLNMILLFITVIVTPIICSLADRHRSHRTYFVISLITTAIAVTFYTLLPLFLDSPKWNKHISRSSNAAHPLQMGPWIYFCVIALVCDLSMGINTCLCDSFAVFQAEEHSLSFGRVIVWGTFGWAGSAVVLSMINQCDFLPRLMPGLLFGLVLLTIDILLIIFWPNQSDFNLDHIPADAAQILTGSTYSVHKDSSNYPPDENIQINLGPELDTNDANEKRKTPSSINVIESTTTPETSQSDKAQLDETSKTLPGLSISRKAEEGQVRSLVDSQNNLVEPVKACDDKTPIQIPMRSRSPTRNKSSQLNLAPSAPKETPNSNQAQDSATQRKQPRITSFRLQLIMLRLILKRRRQLVRYLVLFVLAGFFMSMHWNYFFLYLEDIYFSKFEYISAVSMVAQSILGELPFFILSRKVIGLLGRSHTLSFSIMSIGVRYFLYRYLLPNRNMYYVIIADCLQGPNYGLFYVTMTEISLEYSYCDDETVSKLVAMGELDQNDRRQVDSIRLSLRSTVQSVAFACYEGLGVGLGSVAGGYLVASYDFNTLWCFMAVSAIVVGVANIMVELTCRESDPEEEHSERREYMDSRRKRLQKRMTLPHPIPQAGQPGRPTPPSAARIVVQAADPQVAPPRQVHASAR